MYSKKLYVYYYISLFGGDVVVRQHLHLRFYAKWNTPIWETNPTCGWKDDESAIYASLRIINP